MKQLDVGSFVAMVDHTLLKATATLEQIDTLCGEALELGTAAVCVNGFWVPAVADRIAASDVATCSVVGFPLGAMSTDALADETLRAVDDGADEIDVVIPVGLVVAGDEIGVGHQLTRVRESALSSTLKVIVETAVLTDDQIRTACRLAKAAGADFVKTSTGFDPAGGATAQSVALLRECVGDRLGVKAAGGIRTADDVREMVAAGASRLGMSATADVAAELHA